jgi:hypothetical protein
MAGKAVYAAPPEANEVESNPYERHASSSQEQQFDPSQAKRPANGTHA